MSACGFSRPAYDMTRIACSGARISLNEAPAANDDLPATIRETQTAGSEAPTASILPRFASVKIVQACSVPRPACNATRIACSGVRTSLNEAPHTNGDMAATFRETQPADSEARTAFNLPRLASGKIVDAYSATLGACNEISIAYPATPDASRAAPAGLDV